MIYIGTSGFSYFGWEEKFYKQRLSGIDQLRFYASKFNSVEINYSFYHTPKAETFKKWARATPPDFVFSIKLNRLFTHTDLLQLTEKSEIRLRIFLQNAGELSNKFAVLLIQTPKSLTYDKDRLENFLNIITEALADIEPSPGIVFEFRNKLWHTEEIYNLLSDYEAGLVMADSVRYPQAPVIKSGCLYIRLHGPKKMFDSSYSHSQLKDLKKFIDQHSHGGSVYIYFNNTMQAQAIDNARYLKKLFKNS